MQWKWYEYALLGMIFVMLCVHLLKVLSIPGFYVDEAAGAAHVMCFLQTGKSFDGTSFSLFYPSLGGGYSTHPFLVFQSIWTSLFGTSIDAFRLLSVFAGLISTWGMFVLAYYLAGRMAGLLAAFFISVSPWFFLSTALAWDPPLVLPFLIFGMVFFFAPSRSLFSSFCAGICFSIALLLYPPTKVQLALFLPLLFFYRYGFDIKTAIRKEYPFLLLFFVASAWLIGFYIVHPEALGRSAMLSISGGYYWDIIAKEPSSFLGILNVFLHTMASFLSFDFIAASGDSNLRHHTGFGGMWSGFEMLGVFCGALFLGLSSRYGSGSDKKILWIFLFGYGFGLLPAALTWDGSPHALRSIGAIPFVSLFASLGIVFLLRVFPILRWGGLLLLPCGGAVFLYTVDFFKDYPSRSAVWFEEDVVIAATNAKQSGDFIPLKTLMEQKNYDPLAKAYFLMEYTGEKCNTLKRK